MGGLAPTFLRPWRKARRHRPGAHSIAKQSPSASDWMDALLRNLDALDPLEAEHQLDLVHGRFRRHLAHDGAERLLHVLAEADPLDGQVRQVDAHALARLEHATAPFALLV